MASNGLLKRAKTGKCRMCYRVRSTDKYLKAVGEVHHGSATGHIWECKDEKECEEAANKKIDNGHTDSMLISIMKKVGRAKEYIIAIIITQR